MDTVSIILFLLLAVVASDVLSRLLARALPFVIPRPLVQIGLGAVVGLSTRRAVTLDPQVFFLLLLPPLLFLDGWRIPSEELLKDRRTVSQLALGLVVFTVVGMGVFIHWLVPALPWPVAFALAAVLSPTDPIAVTAIAQRVPITRRMMRILEGESLLNDASGLVCFSFAVAAMTTGTFSLSRALFDFVWVATGGVAVGVGLTLALTGLKNRVSQRIGEDSGSQILISLLIPFGCYLLAEAIHASGILAAVAAGLTMSSVESSGHAMATTRIRRATFWDVIQFSANGVVFVLLGEQLPGIAAGAAATVQLTGHAHPAWLIAYVLAITLGLALLRFAWVMVSLRAGAPGRPSWRLVTVMSLAGVRGAVTLAGVLSLPLLLPGGAPFPGRDLAILLAMGVIIVSLVAASIGLPLLLGGLALPSDPSREAEEASARIAAAHAAIGEIERLQLARSKDQPDADIVVAAAARVMDIYRARIESRAGDAEAIALARKSEAVEREMRLAALAAERTEIFRELRGRRLGSETARKLVREIDLL
ncbi:MAG: Na+/H+ antiporter, partial [Burkholderiales bacterium]